MADLSDASARYIEALEKAAAATTETERNRQLAIAKQIKDANDASKSLGNLGRSSSILGDAFSTAGRAGAGLTQQILRNQADIKGFGTLIGETAKGFGDTLARNGGLVGKTLGGIVSAGGTLVKLMSEQADAALKAKDDLGQLGTAGQLTAKDVLDLANQAGYSSQNIDKFTNGVKAAGTGLLTLGKNTAEGAKRFSEIAAVGDDTIAHFRNLGISQERLTEIQGNYVNYIVGAGRSIESFGKNEAERTANLKKSSLEYANNLVTLASLTGKSVQQIEKEQAVATAAVDFQLSQLALQKQIDDKRAQKDDAQAQKEADDLEKELQKREEIVQKVTVAQGAEVGAALRAALARGGATTEESALLDRAGVDTKKIIALSKDTAKNSTDAANESVALISQAMKKTAENLGPAAIFSAEVAKDFGLTLDVVKRLRQNGETFGKGTPPVGTPGTPGTPGEGPKDPAEVARNALEKTARDVTIELDKAVLSVNPILRGFEAIGKDSDKIEKGMKAFLAAFGVKLLADAAAKSPSGAVPGVVGTGGAPKTRVGEAVKGGAMVAGGEIAKAGGEAAKEAGYEQAGSGLKVAGGALEGAGIGRLLGIIHPALGAIGAAAGAAYGGIKAFIEENAKSDKQSVPQRHGGTLGMTGQLTEPKNIIVELQKGEMVLTAEQQKELLSMDNKGSASAPATGNTSDALSMVLTSKFDEMISKLDQMIAKSSDANDELKNSNRTLSDLLQYTRA